MKLIPLPESFDRQDGMLVRIRDRSEAGSDRFAIEQDGAGAALAFAAAVFCAGQVQLFAQNLEQGSLRIRSERVRLSIDGEGNRCVHTFPWPILRRGSWALH